MSWQVLPLNRSLGTHRVRWDELNQSLYGGVPLFHSDFIDASLKHLAKGDECLCLLREAGSVVGMLIARPTSRMKWSLFAPPQWQICPILLSEPSALRQLIPALPGIPLGLDLFCQDPIHTPLARNVGLPASTIPHAHTIAVELNGSFTDYWSSRTGKHLRKNVAKRIRQLADEGIEVSLGRLDAPEHMRGAVERFGDIESAGWKGQAGTAVHSTNAQGVFYAEVLESFAARGSAAVYELKFGDKLAAMQLCILGPTMMVLLKSTYDEGLAKHAPGRLLKRLMIEREFAERRIPRIEYYTNADADQLNWGTSNRWVQHHALFRNRWIWQGYEWVHRLTLAFR